MKQVSVSHTQAPHDTGALHSRHAFAHPVRNVSAFGIEPGMTVADFGAGSGAYVLAIAEALAGAGTVYAIDVQKDLLRRVHNEAHKRGFKNVHILWADLERPLGSKLADQTCDVVVMSNVLFQLNEKVPVLREAHRILRSRGRLFIIDWQESFGGMGPTKAHVLQKDEAIAQAESAGFKLVSEFPAGAHHYGLALRAITS
jgi:ubiquinone/menaquinone biosynthesis C-methylase UbiE